MKEIQRSQDAPLEADTTYDISDISTDTEITTHLPREETDDTQVSLSPVGQSFKEIYLNHEYLKLLKVMVVGKYLNFAGFFCLIYVLVKLKMSITY